ncbi:hypothetical protein Tco_0161901 [Tanacetum coccineum]
MHKNQFENEADVFGNDSDSAGDDGDNDNEIDENNDDGMDTKIEDTNHADMEELEKDYNDLPHEEQDLLRNLRHDQEDDLLKGQTVKKSKGAVAPGVLDLDIFGFQTLQHEMRMTRTWDSTIRRILNQQKKLELVLKVLIRRIISFGKDVAELHSSKVERVDFKGAVKGNNFANRSCRDVWNEYHEMGIMDIKAIANYKAFTVYSVLELLQFVARRMILTGDNNLWFGCEWGSWNFMKVPPDNLLQKKGNSGVEFKDIIYEKADGEAIAKVK